MAMSIRRRRGSQEGDGSYATGRMSARPDDGDFEDKGHPETKERRVLEIRGLVEMILRRGTRCLRRSDCVCLLYHHGEE